MTLLAMQRDLRNWLDRGDTQTAARFGATAAPGLRVYQNNYRAQLIACLDDSFPHTRAWIGARPFRDAAVAHIARVPPSSWTLDAYPRDFPATLRTLYPDDPEIAELAWLEGALAEAFVGPDAPAITPEQIAATDWDSAVLRFAPTLDQANLTTNATLLWAAMDAGETPPDVALLPETGAMLVWRHEDISRFRAIDREEREALLSARAGISFADMCEELVRRHGDEAGIARAGTMLGHWLSEGLISATGKV